MIYEIARCAYWTSCWILSEILLFYEFFYAMDFLNLVSSALNCFFVISFSIVLKMQALCCADFIFTPLLKL